MKSKRRISEHFEVGIGLHQGSTLSPFLFIMLGDTICPVAVVAGLDMSRDDMQTTSPQRHGADEDVQEDMMSTGQGRHDGRGWP